MPNPHSTVTYVEPNMINQDRNYFDRVPALEEYCIAMNIEVEISSRDSQGSDDKEVLILQWNNGKKESVSFMAGTKIGGYSYEGLDRTPNLNGTDNNLTTYYADMYVGDLIHYGTTEMIGIKSVNIEYAKSCVPVITVQFTDVRGLSLFQPTEFSRDNTYNGIKGLNKDNVAQSFFQCFFKMPLPRFTFYIKGFYGNPVAYVCMCDKFDTNFNSDTGDFDVTARFIGYNYSFLTDISFDALLAAPYSDFYGHKYWEDQVKCGRFFLWDKLKTHKMPMPTLYEVHSDFKRLIRTSNDEMEKTTLTEEEKKHEQEISDLREIRGKYQIWYQKLFDVVKEKYGKRYCFDFKESEDKEADWFRILILTNIRTSDQINMSGEYTQFPNEFKKETDNLYAAIEDFNKSGYSYKKLKNVSKDFSEYTRVKVFNDCYLNRGTRKIDFGGFSPENRLNRTQIINRLFHNTNAQYEQEKDRENYKDYTLSTIYNNGVDQYKDAFVIEVDYSDIKRRILALTADANRNVDEKEREKARKEHNRIMLSRMNWYPSVENFTKIMMAHLETFMMMMYNVGDKCLDRKPEDVGVTVGKNGDACDVPENAKILSPFPRVIKTEIGDDGIPRNVDAWVGDYDNGQKFIEADMINGLFNAVDHIQRLTKEEDAIEDESEEPVVQKPIIKHPLTPYDFHLTKNIYGTDNDVSNNPNAFAGKVAIRMFDILSISNFRKQYSDKINRTNGEFLKTLGAIEAENFYDSIKINNKTMIAMLGAQADSGTIDPQAIINCTKFGKGIGDNQDLPWRSNGGDDDLFDSEFWLSKYTTSYSTKEKTYIYPMQDMSFINLETTLKIFNKGANSVQHGNEDIMVNWIEADANAMSLLKDSNNDSCFGSVFISDDYKLVADVLDASNTSPDNVYGEMYKMINTDSVFNAERFGEMIYSQGVFRPKLGVVTRGNGCYYTYQTNLDSLVINKNDNSNLLQCSGGKTLEYVFDVNKLTDYTTEVENKNITSWFFTECRGYNKPWQDFGRTDTRSLVMQTNYKDDISSIAWGFGGLADKEMGFFLMGLEAIDYTYVAKHLNSNETFTYLPKLAVLQIGAALASMSTIKEVVSITTLSKKLPLPNTFGNIVEYLNKINYTTRIAYIKYFRNWVNKNRATIHNNFLGSSDQICCEYVIGEDTKKRKAPRRVLFREDTEVMASLTNELMCAVSVTKGNVNHFRGVTKKGLEIDEYVATLYLDGFLNRLRDLYSVGEEKTSGDGVQLVKSSAKTTEDMKKELYRYLKLVYDKWVPAMDRDSWKFETFFDIDEEEKIKGKKGCVGHLFHFIDSFYNKIGDKLLINPRVLSEKIDSILKTNDTNMMMLGFMDYVYGQNKCMMICLQNFLDLGNDKSMDVLFKPVAYNDMPDPHRHPDFVILYPYEPSKYLDVDNGEFNNDTFMLNDEFETPLPIRGRGGDKSTYYQLPAFGVSYGKQYQSYFKKVSVGMSSPIATQQAIMAKHAILRASQDTATKAVVAQDMYDVYATFSYTCKVEMMGCAWIQPLMYFVLTNVPMFRGSYLIFKVTHKITPGNMITEFQGTRMANVSNKLVEEIFTDEDFEGEAFPYLENKKHEKADVDNNCPYKTFPLFEEGKYVKLTDQAKKDGIAIMEKLIGIGFNGYAAAGIVGNMYVESHDYRGTGLYFKYDLVVEDSGSSGGLCMWHNGNLIDLCEGKTTGLGHNKTYIKFNKANKDLYTKKLRNVRINGKSGLDAQLEYLKATMTKTKGTKEVPANYVPLEFNTYNKMADDAKSASVSAKKFRILYEKSSDKTQEEKEANQERCDVAHTFYALYKGGDNAIKTAEPNKDGKKDIYEALFIALQKSVDSTLYPCKLEMVKYTSDIMIIKQEDGKYDRLPLVFDILLNGYYEYVQKLWWVSPNDDFKNNPVHIDVTASLKPAPEKRTVMGMVTGQANKASGLTFTKETRMNESFLKAIWKKYHGLHPSEIPQFTDKDIFDGIEVKPCGFEKDYGSDGGDENYESKGANSLWAKAVQSMGQWYEKNVHTYQKRMYDCSMLNSKVRDDCSGYVSACLQYFGTFKKGVAPSSADFVSTTNSTANILYNGGFRYMMYSWDNVQPYDIIAYNGHVEVLAQKGENPKSWGWGSVHDCQGGHGCMPAFTGPKPKGSTYKAIWRYVG